MQTREPLSLWTVYDSPSDYPGQFVARRFIVDREGFFGTEDIVLAHTLDGVRGQLPDGLYCLGRNEKDAPPIVEVWV